MRLRRWSATLLLALACSCSPAPPPASLLDVPPKVGDFVKMRGTLTEDVDCRLFRTEDGHVYSLSVKLRGYANGTKLCVHGTLSDATQCLHTPMIEVESIRPWGSCP